MKTTRTQPRTAAAAKPSARAAAGQIAGTSFHKAMVLDDQDFAMLTGLSVSEAVSILLGDTPKRLASSAVGSYDFFSREKLRGGELGHHYALQVQALANLAKFHQAAQILATVGAALTRPAGGNSGNFLVPRLP